MEAIVKLWFEDGRIYILTDQGNTYSRPLEAFPLLLDATPEQRAHYEIGLDGDDIHWDDIDEDIHISSFYVTAEPDTNNPIAEVFHKFPQLNVSEVARTIGINKSLLSRYIYGIKKPSVQRTEQILGAIRQLIETEYIISQPELVEAIRQEDEDVKNGNYEVVNIDEL